MLLNCSVYNELLLSESNLRFLEIHKNYKHKMNIFQSYIAVFRKANLRSLYVLIILLFTYLINQLDRYALPIVSKPMAQELHFGEKSCMLGPNVSTSYTKECENRNSTV